MGFFTHFFKKKSHKEIEKIEEVENNDEILETEKTEEVEEVKDIEDIIEEEHIRVLSLLEIDTIIEDEDNNKYE